MCDDVTQCSEDSYSLQYVPDWFVTQQETFFEDVGKDDELIAWCNGYK